jgi:hypothetical protein
MICQNTRGIGIFIVFLIGGVFIIGGAMAVDITESPHQIVPGDQVTLSIRGLPDNSAFSLQILGTFSVKSGSSFIFQTSHFVMPFSLKDGELHATVDNTKQAFLEVSKGDQMASVGKNTITDGHFSYSGSRTIDAGTYDSLTLRGSALDSSQPVTTLLQLNGVKSGPDDSEITFNVVGIEAGTLHVTVMVDGNSELSQDVVIGNPQETPSAGPASPPGQTPVNPVMALLGVGAAFFVYDRTGGAS